MPSKIYIIGAGCSKDCGYPLGPQMKADLETFRDQLDPSSSERLIRAITQTVELLDERINTIDALIQKVSEGRLDEALGIDGLDIRQRNIQRSLRERAAALSITANFVAKESTAVQTGLPRYQNLLADLFPGAESTWDLFANSDSIHVLTFNYDRLFELAFLDRFNLYGCDPYGIKGLNAGLDAIRGNIRFAPNAFSFIKIHGSVGMAITDLGRRNVGPYHFHGQIFPLNRAREPLVISDNLFFTEPTSANPDGLKVEPLLFFPSQRQFILGNESGFSYHNYVTETWARARHLVSQASEIHVIGYSFGGIDRGPFLDLLQEATLCQRITVRNPSAEQLCANLAIERPDLEKLLRAYPYPF